MHEWLEKVIPRGPWHAWAVEGSEAALKVLLAVWLFIGLRWTVLRAIDTVMRPLLARAQREGETSTARLRTLEGLARSSITYVLLFVTGVTLLSHFDVNVAAILASAGVAGLALSFGAQRLVRDLLTGIFILLEDQFRVGEVVTLVLGPGLPQMNGSILEMGLRITRLLDISGKLVSVANGDIVAVINHHRGPVTATIEVGVDSNASLDRIRELVAELSLSDGLFTGPAAVQGVTSLEVGKVGVRIAAPGSPGRAPEAELALRQAVGEALRKAEVEIR
ncbi:MAG: Small-conductance mechanosensitive channel [Armatimonadetes bacterium]|jgi:small conductance mechanosensitive channel|nr:Small-conductance mechanosensitive channel [Armatimonadota bacterium]